MTILYGIAIIMILVAVYLSGYFRAKHKYEKQIEKVKSDIVDSLRMERIEELKEIASEADSDFYREVYGK